MASTPTPGLSRQVGPTSSGVVDPKHAAGLGMPQEADNTTTTPSPIEARLATFIGDHWEDLRTSYTVFHQMCWQNILYYAGQLWINWDASRRIWYPAVPDDEYTPQPNVNYFAPAIDSITAIFKIPAIECMPKQQTNEDAHEVAEIGNALADEFMRQNALDNGGSSLDKTGKGDIASQLFTLCGNFFTIVKQKEYGVGEQPDIETVPININQCPQCATITRTPVPDPATVPSPGDLLMGQQVNGPGITPPTPPICQQCQVPMTSSPSTDTRQKKDPITGVPLTNPIIKHTAECHVGNPLFALPRAGSSCPEAAGYTFWAERMWIDDIYRLWKFEAQPDNQYLDSMESSWEIAMNYYFTGYSNLTLSNRESALVLIVYIEPDRLKEIPEGGVAVWINGQLVRYDRWQDVSYFGHQLTHAGYLKMPTTYFYRTSAFDLAQVQKELNRYESVIALHSMTAASDSLVIDENTKVSNVSGRGDRIIYFRSIGPGSKEPHRLVHGSLDNGIYEQRQKLQDVLQNISGAVNVWRGQQAGSVTAASGISQLRSQAEQMFSKPVDNWNGCWTATVAKGVKILQKVLQPWEIAAIMGKGHDVQIAKFKAANLDDMLEWKATTHGLPKTRDERRQDLLSLFDRKMLDIQDPNVREEIAELFGNTGMGIAFNLDATRARAENDRMGKGEKVQFMPDVEDLQVHLFIHGEFIKRLDFDQLEQPVQQLVLSHYMETKMALNQQMLMSTESQVEYKAAAIGKAAPEQAKPGTLLGGGPGQPSEGGGSPDGGHTQPKPAPANPAAPKPVPSGKTTVRTGPTPKQ